MELRGWVGGADFPAVPSAPRSALCMEACKEPVKLGFVFPPVEAGCRRRRNYWFLPAELHLIFGQKFAGRHWNQPESWQKLCYSSYRCRSQQMGKLKKLKQLFFFLSNTEINKLRKVKLCPASTPALFKTWITLFVERHTSVSKSVPTSNVRVRNRHPINQYEI